MKMPTNCEIVHTCASDSCCASAEHESTDKNNAVAVCIATYVLSDGGHTGVRCSVPMCYTI